MSELTLHGLMEILKQSAGADEEAAEDLSAVTATAGDDSSFADLGYDSLALLETVNRVERRYGVRLSDEIADTRRTPAWLLDQINAAFSAGTRP